MRYTQKYIKENNDLNEVAPLVATAGKAILGMLFDKGKELTAAGFKPSRPTHATFGGVNDPNQRRGREVTDRIVSKLTGGKRSSGDGDSSKNQSTPTKADTETEKYSPTEQSFKNKRKDLTKFPKIT
jgi:hypothetical protein